MRRVLDRDRRSYPTAHVLRRFGPGKTVQRLIEPPLSIVIPAGRLCVHAVNLQSAICNLQCNSQCPIPVSFVLSRRLASATRHFSVPAGMPRTRAISSNV